MSTTASPGMRVSCEPTRAAHGTSGSLHFQYSILTPYSGTQPSLPLGNSPSSLSDPTILQTRQQSDRILQQSLTPSARHHEPLLVPPKLARPTVRRECACQQFTRSLPDLPVREPLQDSTPVSSALVFSQRHDSVTSDTTENGRITRSWMNVATALQL